MPTRFHFGKDREEWATVVKYVFVVCLSTTGVYGTQPNLVTWDIVSEKVYLAVTSILQYVGQLVGIHLMKFPCHALLSA